VKKKEPKNSKQPREQKSKRKYLKDNQTREKNPKLRIY
jgi:hypothetical protein